MTFTFPRLSAGVYEIQKNSNTVGFIRKQSASKWIVVDVLDTPQHVSKTLKDAKFAAENFIIFDVDNTQKDEYDDSVRDEDKGVDTLEIQRELLENNYVIDLSKEPTLEPIEF